ncbi:MAG: phage tail protein [Tumebacillaceae bacterium]
MSEPYLSEVRMFAGNFAPRGWALCQGQLLSIAQNEALFSLLGTTYGGDGQTTFALPDLQGRVPIHANPTYPQGAKGGTEAVTLLTGQIPSHTHQTMATTSAGNQTLPTDQLWATTATTNYHDGSGQTPVLMSAQTIAVQGGSQPHDNMMPTLTVSFIISLEGIYPSQN